MIIKTFYVCSIYSVSNVLPRLDSRLRAIDEELSNKTQVRICFVVDV